ncbi:hypothetical protein FPZ42_02230 [Mucilaginibacter achroorhodeus]|uniref:Uncharacterized protein n=1 Tax=Mucilaginibacter achroorhodeus TaxID=2599294 RepID=A0A563U9N7_9SPHI|nr:MULTISPECIES: hypothetical protein [Mucilaginibacter]QXV66968.1 hypothetical protein INP83_07765 [Mucilaginibacter sp. 21P]TWR28054.1 hypothetical protein FPZ42_02230 [Mucilaginibacter achroorhodeus]
MNILLPTTNPAQLLQEKNGEHPGHLSLPAERSVLLSALKSQSLSAQHGRTDKNKTMTENKMHRNFTAQT